MESDFDMTSYFQDGDGGHDVISHTKCCHLASARAARQTLHLPAPPATLDKLFSVTKLCNLVLAVLVVGSDAGQLGR